MDALDPHVAIYFSDLIIDIEEEKKVDLAKIFISRIKVRKISLASYFSDYCSLSIKEKVLIFYFTQECRFFADAILFPENKQCIIDSEIESARIYNNILWKECLRQMT